MWRLPGVKADIISVTKHLSVGRGRELEKKRRIIGERTNAAGVHVYVALLNYQYATPVALSLILCS